jgi:hypothetical protein
MKKSEEFNLIERQLGYVFDNIYILSHHDKDSDLYKIGLKIHEIRTDLVRLKIRAKLEEV